MTSAGRVEAPARLLDREMGQRLHGFSQAHVVGQDAAHPRVAQELQPIQAALLIGPQGGEKRLGHRTGRNAAGIAQLPPQGAQRLPARPGDAARGARRLQQGEISGGGARHAQMRARLVKFRSGEEFQQGSQDGPELGKGHGQQPPIGQRQQHGSDA